MLSLSLCSNSSLAVMASSTEATPKHKQWTHRQFVVFRLQQFYLLVSLVNLILVMSSSSRFHYELLQTRNEALTQLLVHRRIRIQKTRTSTVFTWVFVHLKGKYRTASKTTHEEDSSPLALHKKEGWCPERLRFKALANSAGPTQQLVSKGGGKCAEPAQLAAMNVKHTHILCTITPSPTPLTVLSSTQADTTHTHTPKVIAISLQLRMHSATAGSTRRKEILAFLSKQIF